MRLPSWLRGVVPLAVSCVTGCADAVRRVTPEVGAAAPVAARLDIRDDGADGLLVSAVASPADTTRIGSFSATVRFDPAGFAYAREAHPADGAMRVVRSEAGVVQVAGAAATGFPDGTLFTLVFRKAAGAEPTRLVLDIRELTRVTGSDATRQATVAAPRVVDGARP